MWLTQNSHKLEALIDLGVTQKLPDCVYLRKISGGKLPITSQISTYGTYKKRTQKLCFFRFRYKVQCTLCGDRKKMYVSTVSRMERTIIKPTCY